MEAQLGITRSGVTDLKNRMAQTANIHSFPKEFLRQNSNMMDSLVRKAFQKAQSQVDRPSVCLIAVGGYGRGELAPHSDIDLLLLYPSSQKKELPPLVEKILYPLWDLGLEVNCSSRSSHECIKMAQSDLHVKTSLIDGRYLDGEYELFRNVTSRFMKNILHKKVRQFAESLARELRTRHRKYEDPNYALEPNIKEGEGGLRDFQIGRWLIRAKYRTDRWNSILFPDHSQMLERSVQFLWAVRNQLHLLSGRRQDDFTFEWQEKIAPNLGFSHGTAGIEEMLRRYHLSAQKISNFVDNILDRILREPFWVKKIFFFFQRKKIDGHFKTSNRELHLLDPVTFKKDPSQLMTLFQHCQTYRAKMDFRTEEAVMEALPFIDDFFRNSEKVNQTFLPILRKGEGVAPLLRKMHELGFLSQFIPEFSEIEGKVHYDLYHVHPVDIHSILAVKELAKLRKGNYQKEYPLLTSLAKEIEKPEILFLTALLHDIGKGKEGDHSLIGAEMTKHIAARMGLSLEEKECIGFLVSHHLLMVETAIRRDLHDEQIILRFAKEIANLNRLKLLYLLTFADIKAVGSDAWNSWKDALLKELFLKTSHFLERDSVGGHFLKKEGSVKKLEKFLSPEIFSEYGEHLPDRYLSCYSPEEISHHIEMAHSVEKEHLLIEWKTMQEVRSKVTVCTKDRYGLFSKITGTMFLNRLNILEAQIHTWGNGIALDTFWVEDATQDSERRLRQFKKDLGEILAGNISLRALLSHGKESSGIKQKIVPKVPEEVTIDNQDSDFYTIIEVVGEDRLGILYELTQGLTDHGCHIHFARISTLGNRIVDVFYVQDQWGEKIVEKNKTDQLKRTILSCLTIREESSS